MMNSKYLFKTLLCLLLLAILSGCSDSSDPTHDKSGGPAGDSGSDGSSAEYSYKEYPSPSREDAPAPKKADPSKLAHKRPYERPKDKPSPKRPQQKKSQKEPKIDDKTCRLSSQNLADLMEHVEGQVDAIFASKISSYDYNHGLVSYVEKQNQGNDPHLEKCLKQTAKHIFTRQARHKAIEYAIRFSGFQNAKKLSSFEKGKMTLLGIPLKEIDSYLNELAKLAIPHLKKLIQWQGHKAWDKRDHRIMLYDLVWTSADLENPEILPTLSFFYDFDTQDFKDILNYNRPTPENDQNVISINGYLVTKDILGDLDEAHSYRSRIPGHVGDPYQLSEHQLWPFSKRHRDSAGYKHVDGRMLDAFRFTRASFFREQLFSLTKRLYINLENVKLYSQSIGAAALQQGRFWDEETAAPKVKKVGFYLDWSYHYYYLLSSFGAPTSHLREMRQYLDKANHIYRLSLEKAVNNLKNQVNGFVGLMGAFALMVSSPKFVVEFFKKMLPSFVKSVVEGFKRVEMHPNGKEEWFFQFHDAFSDNFFADLQDAPFKMMLPGLFFGPKDLSKKYFHQLSLAQSLGSINQQMTFGEASVVNFKDGVDFFFLNLDELKRQVSLIQGLARGDFKKCKEQLDLIKINSPQEKILQAIETCREVGVDTDSLSILVNNR